MQKFIKPNFPLYFWQNPLYFFNGLLGSLNGLKWIFCRKQTLSKIQFYIGIHLNQIQILNFENLITPSDHRTAIAEITQTKYPNKQELKSMIIKIKKVSTNSSS